MKNSEARQGEEGVVVNGKFFPVPLETQQKAIAERNNHPPFGKHLKAILIVRQDCGYGLVDASAIVRTL